MYKILGADSREYGPVSAEQLITWINEGRANGATLVQGEGATEWKPLSTFPEFAEALRSKPAPPPPPPPGAPPLGASPTASPSPASTAQLLARDYSLDIGQCISRSWDLYKQNFGLIFGVTAIFLLIAFVMGLLGCIPFVGLLASLGSFLITGPLGAGVYTVFLRRFRGQSATVNDLFSGFSNRYWQYVLAYLIPSVLTWIAIIPGAFLIGIGAAFARHSQSLGVILVLVGALLLLVPALYLGVAWLFTLPLVLDKGLEFWPAMQASFKMTHKHFGSVFGLMILTGIIGLLGFILCGVGIFFTFPIVFGAIAFAYLTIFGEQPAAALPSGSAPSGTTPSGISPTQP